MSIAKGPKFDLVKFIVEFEDGKCTPDDVVIGFQYIINANLCTKLQGLYKWMAELLIKEGLCFVPDRN